MTPEQQIQEVYRQLKTTISPALVARLTFKKPEQLDKHGSKKWRGRILASRPRTIFDSAWCFFEVGVGRYLAETTNCGGVGLVCFVENKKCGGGQHAMAVHALAHRLAGAHDQFSASRRGDKNQGVFVYYPGFEFPIQKAVDDMGLLINECLEIMESLHVEK